MITESNGVTVITGEHVNLVAMLSAEGRLKLHMRGLKSPLWMIRQKFGLKSKTAKAMYEELHAKRLELFPLPPE